VPIGTVAIGLALTCPGLGEASQVSAQRFQRLGSMPFCNPEDGI